MRISSESVSGRREGRRRDGNKDGEGGGPIAIAPSEKQGMILRSPDVLNLQIALRFRACPLRPEEGYPEMTEAMFIPHSPTLNNDVLETKEH